MTIAPPPEPLLEVEGLVTRYPIARGLVESLARQPKEWVHAVEGVSFSVGAGEMMALVGESGCGKTTTAQTIVRMVDHDSGSIRFQGEEIAGPRIRRCGRCGASSRSSTRIPTSRWIRASGCGARSRSHFGSTGSAPRQEDRRERVRDALARAGLTPPDLYLDRFRTSSRAASASELRLPRHSCSSRGCWWPTSRCRCSTSRYGRAFWPARWASQGRPRHAHDHARPVDGRPFRRSHCVMYLGRIVEEGPAKEVVRTPQHPYTRALISVVPKRDPRFHRADPVPARRPTRSTSRPAAAFTRAVRSPPTCASYRPGARPAKDGRGTRAPRSMHADVTRGALARHRRPRRAVFPSGPRNAITDVAGVRVGHSQASTGEATGVTVMVPPDAPGAGRHVSTVNGVGELTKKLEIDEWG